MELRLKVVENGEQLTLMDALRLGKVISEEHRLCSDTARILRSTELFDMDEQEIFEGDTAVDERGRSYSIIYRNGAFFLAGQSENNCQIIPLYLLQGNEHVPIKITKSKL